MLAKPAESDCADLSTLVGTLGHAAHSASHLFMRGGD
jgi:hypothetical protein